MGFYKIDYEILDYLKTLEGSPLRGGGRILEFGAQDLMQDRAGNVKRSENSRISAFEAYKEYGATEYVCIDPEGAHNALPYDLGEPLANFGFKEQFDIVTIKEIGHWIFDQKTLWKNIHNSVKKGGYIIWRSPISGGFGSGCFIYMPNKVLQLGFCNNYLYKGAWVYKEVCGIPNGTFGSWSQERHYRFESFSAADFLPLLKQYLQKNLMSVQMQDGIPIIRLTMIFQKVETSEFVPPFFPYRPEEECLARNTKAILKNCFPPLARNKLAIFGAKRAANLASIFCESANIEVLCFISDDEGGEFRGKPIVSWEEFIEKYQNNCDLILKGPLQNGQIENRGARIPILELDMQWFV